MKKYINYLILTIIVLSQNVFASDELEAVYLKESNSQDFIFEQKENVTHEVFFFFSYHCPSCYKFKMYENEIEKFLKNNQNVKYYKIPVQFFKGWNKGAEMHYLSKNLNTEEKDIENKLYEFINTEKYSAENILGFLQTNINKNLTIEDVKNQLSSNKIKYQMEKSIELENKLNVEATPTIIVINKNKERFKIQPSINKDYKNMVISTLYLTFNN